MIDALIIAGAMLVAGLPALVFLEWADRRAKREEAQREEWCRLDELAREQRRLEEKWLKP